MNTKGLIIIGIIALLCVGAGAYVLLSSTPEYKNITMNGVTFEVPASNVNVTNQTEHYSIYNDSEHGIQIYVFDSENSTLSDMSEAATFAGIREAYQVGAQLQQESNVSFNYSDTSKTYTYLTNYTHKNVFIITKNKEDMKHILSSINTDAITIKLNDTQNQTNNTTTVTTKKSTKSSSKNKDPDYDPERDASHQGATEDNPITVQQSDGEYTYYGPGHYDYYAGGSHMSGGYYKNQKYNSRYN